MRRRIQGGGLATKLKRDTLAELGDAEQAAFDDAAALERDQKEFELADKGRDPLVWCHAAQRFEIARQAERGRYGEAESLAQARARKSVAALQG